MATVHLRSTTLAGTSASATAPWQPMLRLLEQTNASADRRRPVLYVHGATFASGNSVFFKFDGASWADALNAAGHSVWSFDFAGFGGSEIYPEMQADVAPPGEPLGRAPEAVRQMERAVRAIVAETGAPRVSIIAHSWGTIATGRFAAAHPELVDRIVFFGPVTRREILGGVPPLGPWRFVTVEEQRKRFVEDVPVGQPGVLVEADFPAWAELFLAWDPTSAARVSASSRALNAGSVQARATTWAPSAGVRLSMRSMLAAISAAVKTPFSISSSRSASSSTS